MGHDINPHNVKVLSDQNHTIKCCIKEAITIKQRKPSLNNDERLELPAIYNPLLGICNNLSIEQPDILHFTDEVQMIWAKYSICFKLLLWNLLWVLKFAHTK